jgi:hypothetical protein
MESIEEAAMSGAWKALCAGVLLQAVERLRLEVKLHKPGSKYRTKGDSGLHKEKLHQRVVAREWIEGGVGLITFEDCCESVGVDPDRARIRIMNHCQNGGATVRRPERSVIASLNEKEARQAKENCRVPEALAVH